jgi:hypothetical protein
MEAVSSLARQTSDPRHTTNNNAEERGGGGLMVVFDVS